jgi:NAD(P)-dependent dehydrogenase (short-subunit alcohol dehydrogenase family)
MGGWAVDRLGDLDGRSAVITGASSGVGCEVARLLASRRATVLLACRDPARAAAAERSIQATTPGASVQVLLLDLASLASVRLAAEQLHDRLDALDLLVNNAGVMRCPYARTEDGFELHFGTNHLGHFAFTGLVLDLLGAVPGSRVVTVTSPAHHQGRVDFEDLQSAQLYRKADAYAQSKLANLLFTYELQRRLVAWGAKTISVAAHPGVARTELNRHMPWVFRGPSWGLARPISHSVEAGALPLVRAALDPEAHGGEYYGPAGRMELRGAPVRRESSAASHDAELASRLWAVSEELTGVHYPKGA